MLENFAASEPRRARRRSAARTRSASRRGSIAEHEFPVVGVPKTIDNDLAATDYTFGFDTAVSIATEAIDRLHTTAESHNRVMVVEVMGRHTGWIAVMSGIAGGADVILIPEQPMTVEEACAEIERRHARGKDFSIVVVSEGYELTYSSGESRLVAGRRARHRPVRPRRARRRRRRARAGDRVADGLRDARDRARSRSARRHADRARPRARDPLRPEGRRLVHEGRFGRMAALHGDRIVDVSLAEATAELKTVPPEWYEVARAFFGCSGGRDPSRAVRSPGTAPRAPLSFA